MSVTRTDAQTPPNPWAERSLIVGMIAVRIWNIPAQKWVTAELIASGDRDGVMLFGLGGDAVVEIRMVEE